MEDETPSPDLISPVEARFETRKKLVGLALGPLLFIAILIMPLEGLSRGAHLLAAVFTWTVIYWVSEALPVAVTAILSSVLSIVLGIAPASAVLAAYSDPIIFLFIGSFILAASMRETGLDRRFAFALLRYRWATQSPARILATMGVIVFVISLWVSNTATTAMMLPVGLGILRSLGRAGDPRRSRFPIGLLLMLTWSSSVAVGIPVGSPPNLIAIGMIEDLTDRSLTFFDWVAVTMPIAILMLILCWAILRRRYRGAGATQADIQVYVANERRKLGRWSRAETNVALVFALAVTLWMFPGAVAMLAEAIGQGVVRISGAESLWALTAVAIVIGVILSEASSNTASASMVIPTMIAVAQGTGVSPIPPTLGAALGASFGFMLPVSTPPNAIVYGSGLVPLKEMITSGIWLDVSGAILIWIGLRILCPLLGVL